MYILSFSPQGTHNCNSSLWVVLNKAWSYMTLHDQLCSQFLCIKRLIQLDQHYVNAWFKCHICYVQIEWSLRHIRREMGSKFISSNKAWDLSAWCRKSGFIWHTPNNAACVKCNITQSLNQCDIHKFDVTQRRDAQLLYVSETDLDQLTVPSLSAVKCKMEKLFLLHRRLHELWIHHSEECSRTSCSIFNINSCSKAKRPTPMVFHKAGFSDNRKTCMDCSFLLAVVCISTMICSYI